MPAAPGYSRAPAVKTHYSSWTEERVERLKVLWLAGWSASQIARELGGITRNAAIGKVARLGMSRHANRTKQTKTVTRPKRCGRAATQKAAPPPVLRLVVANVPELEPLIGANGAAATVLTVTDETCRWPIGDPQDKDFGFCGRGSERGPYCEHHARRAFTPVAQRTRSTPDETRAELRRMMARGW